MPELWPKLTLDKRGRELWMVEVLGCLNFLSAQGKSMSYNNSDLRWLFTTGIDPRHP